MKINRYIESVGVELEGGWDSMPPAYERRGHADGSIGGLECDVVGEISSPVFFRWPDLRKFISDNCPEYVNTTCGLHVHFKMPDAYYAVLMEREFQDFFRARIRKWAENYEHEMPKHFWDRLEGSNHYCLNEWRADEQARQHGRNPCRYCHWNFCHQFHGTVECRMLPATNSPAIAFASIKSLAGIACQWIRANAKKPLEFEEVESLSDATVILEELPTINGLIPLASSIQQVPF